MPKGGEKRPAPHGLLLDASHLWQVLREREERIAALEKENAALRVLLRHTGQTLAIVARDAITLSSAPVHAFAQPPLQPPADER